jgi:phage gpG-like protein
MIVVSSGLNARVEGMERAGGQMAPVFHKLRRPLLDDQREHALRAEGPDGPWPGWRKYRGRWQSTGSRKRSRRPLGKLPKATQTRHTTRSVYVRSVVRWAAVHQEGGTAGKGAVMPARPFLWVSETLRESAAREIAAHLEAGWKDAR